MSAATHLSLKNKTAFITGASGGIGSATAEIFIKAEAKVVATDLKISKTIEKLIQENPKKIEFFELDLMQKNGLDEAKKIINQNCPEVLFNNAAIFDMAPIYDNDTGQYEKIFNLNVKVCYELMQGVIKQLIAQNKPGSVINLSSQAGRRGEALLPHYCASKATVISYTQSTALAVAKNKIRVNAISPGIIDTPMWNQVDALFAKYENLKLGEKKQLVKKIIPMGRMGSADEVAKLALFLASDFSSYITGQTINIDGGNVLS